MIRDVSAYDRLVSLRHSLAFAGVVLGAVGGGLRVGLGLLLASFVLPELSLVGVYLGATVAFGYGAIVGLLVGSQLPGPGPLAMRRGLARGKAIVRVMIDDLASSMLVHDVLVGRPGAERSFCA